MLSVCQFRASFRRLTGMLKSSARVTSIALVELGNCLGWSYGRLFRMRGISRSGKVISAKQTDHDEATDEVRLSHTAIYEGTGLFVQFESQKKRFATYFHAQRALQPRRRGSYETVQSMTRLFLF